jgi:arsenate reductase (glutaredoxin)
MELWHNPRCSKSRSAKAVLDDRSIPYEERRYLEQPPTTEELDRVLTAMDKEPWEIARLGEEVAKQLDLRQLPHDRHRWLAVMAANPVLIERPILVADDGRAVIGRPTEAIEPLL